MITYNMKYLHVEVKPIFCTQTCVIENSIKVINHLPTDVRRRFNFSCQLQKPHCCFLILAQLWFAFIYLLFIKFSMALKTSCTTLTHLRLPRTQKPHMNFVTFIIYTILTHNGKESSPGWFP